MNRAIVIGLLAVFALTGCACSNKGKAGDKCGQAADCARGYFCEGKICKAGPETACSYLARCVPVMDRDQVETLFSEGGRELLQSLQSNPVESSCEKRLKIFAMANRIVILNRACGPRVREAP